jgi:putative component of toxin-antitoxin plasmid stabilization module
MHRSQARPVKNFRRSYRKSTQTRANRTARGRVPSKSALPTTSRDIVSPATSSMSLIVAAIVIEKARLRGISSAAWSDAAPRSDGIANARTDSESEFRIYAPPNVRRTFVGQGRHQSQASCSFSHFRSSDHAQSVCRTDRGCLRRWRCLRASRSESTRTTRSARPRRRSTTGSARCRAAR